VIINSRYILLPTLFSASHSAMSNGTSSQQFVFPHATGQALDTVQKHQGHNELVLYSAWFCPFSQRCWIALEERGIPYQYVEVDPFKKDPQFLELNPKGLVPAIKHQGRALYESSIICEFLEDAYPDHEPQLLPRDPIARAHARLWIDYISQFIKPSFLRLFHAPTPELQATALNDYKTALKAFASQIRGPYFLGEEFSLVDAAMASWVVRDYILVDCRGFSREGVSVTFKAYADGLEERESVRKTVSVRENYTEIFERFLRNKTGSPDS